MASRAARSMFSNAARASPRTTRAAQQLGRRYMNASASAHKSQQAGSDRPWIIGSALFFGPFFLYLLSPSARKSHAQHAIHDDKHDFGIHESASHHAEVKMKDDEGIEANVTEALAASEHEDAPKVGEAVEKEYSPPSSSSSPDVENVKDSQDEGAKDEPSESDVATDENRHRQLEKVESFQARGDINADTDTAGEPDIIEEGLKQQAEKQTDRKAEEA